MAEPLSEKDLFTVDWSRIPAPQNDGGADHLEGTRLPAIALAATDGRTTDLAALPGRSVVYTYPMTGRPGVPLPEGWDMIPGARGCSPQSCGFRDLMAELRAAGAAHVCGLSTQDTTYQREAAERLHLPFPLLSDEGRGLTRALRLPTLTVEGRTLLARSAWIVDDGRIRHVLYPVFPPDRNAEDVLVWLKAHPR
mgnify:CR=1 FL=1